MSYLTEEAAAEARRTLLVTPSSLSANDEDRRLEAVAAEVARRRALRGESMASAAGEGGVAPVSAPGAMHSQMIRVENIALP